MQDNKIKDELDLAVLKRLSSDGNTSQRNLSEEMNVSLGGINYCLRALIEKGLVKAKNFRKSNNKLAYLYLLTPNGISEKMRLTRKFLAIKKSEYLKIQTQIKLLEKDLVNEEDKYVK